MDLLSQLPPSDSIFMEKIYRDFSSTRDKFVRACNQIQRLNGRLYQLQERYERALWWHRSDFAYSYKAQMICVEGVLCVFEEYVRRKSDHLILIAKMIDHLNMVCLSPGQNEAQDVNETSALYGLLRGDEQEMGYEEEGYEEQHEEYEVDTSSSSEEEDEEDEDGGVYWWRSSDEETQDSASDDVSNCDCELCSFNQGSVRIQSEQIVPDVEAGEDLETRSFSL